MASKKLLLEVFKSNEERFFYRMSQSFPQLVEPFRGFQVESVMYEGKRFAIGETTYTPDFNLVLSRYVVVGDSTLKVSVLVNVEVKGSKKQRGYELTRAKLSIAASSFPEYVWVEVMVDGRGFVFESFEIIDKKPLVYVTRTVEKGV